MAAAFNGSPPPGHCRARQIELPAPPPANAIVLFDGKDLSNWADAKGGPGQMEGCGRRH